ncbi:glycosyl transferase [Winogradskya consettensis]|uniref:Glycosyl transferase n=1 Tax=Winogradskya consettensis TaxID=113560 RepID=A0A919T3V0_9ACTN|nr:glycosyl transferase [Actinoplanes consettensis]
MPPWGKKRLPSPEFTGRLANVRLVSVVEAAPSESAEPPAVSGGARARARLRSWRPNLVMGVASLVLAAYMTNGLWRDPATSAIAENKGDQAFFEWILGYGVYTLSHGADPFYTWMMNAPLGVNLAANTSITVYTVLFSPLTFLAGPQVSFVAILTLNLAGSAFAWWLFLRRYLVRNPAAAALGGIFCGFAPGFVSHANGHLNWTAGWVAPVVLWWVLKLREPGHWIRNGVVLGVLIAVGFSIAAEGLFFTALASGVFLAVWSLLPATRQEARAALPTVLAGLVTAAVIALGLLMYPLYMHFDGPRTFTGTGFNQFYYSEGLAAYFEYPTRSIAGSLGWGNDLAPNATEETSYFGAPLMVLVVVAFVTLWRRAEAGRRSTLAALMTVGLVFFVLSLGPELKIFKPLTGIWLPYQALMHLPLFDSALPARLALVVVGVFGIVLALTADRLLSEPLPSVTSHTVWAAGYALALLPLFPLPIVTEHRAPEPAFIADGIWRDYVSDNGVLSTLPFATTDMADGQRWQAYTMARAGKQFRIPDGYFLGPGGPDGTGQIGASARNTDWLFFRAAFYGYVQPIDDFDRERAREDFRYWNLEAVFLADDITGSHSQLYRSAVEITATDLLGQPERVGGVLLWRIRPGVDPQ